MLKLIDLSFSFAKSNYLIKNLNYEIKGNSIIGLFGHSGTGKTTLLNILGGLLKPLHGDVSFDNIKIYNSAFGKIINYRKNIVGYAFQNFNLLDGFSVKDNINLPFFMGTSNVFDKKWAEYLLQELEINKIIHKKIDKISGGEKERVSLIKSMIHKPSILILDEPGTYLNLDLRKKVYKLIKEYANLSNNIVLLTSHNEDIIDYMGLKIKQKNNNLNIYEVNYLSNVDY